MAYCTLANLQELGYSWGSTDIDNITQICDTASKMVDAYCKQTFSQHIGYAEIHKARVRDGIIKVFPLNMTVSNVQSITFINVYPGSIQFICSNPQYIPLGYIIAATNATNGEYLVTLKYDFGFADGSYPAEIVKATVLAAAPLLDDYFLSQDSNISMIKSIKQGELSISRSDTDKLPQNAIDILNGGNNGRGWVRVRAG